MNVTLQSNNTRHRLAFMSKLDHRIGYTICGEIFASIGSKCPSNKEHAIIFPKCILNPLAVEYVSHENFTQDW